MWWVFLAFHVFYRNPFFFYLLLLVFILVVQFLIQFLEFSLPRSANWYGDTFWHAAKAISSKAHLVSVVTHVHHIILHFLATDALSIVYNRIDGQWVSPRAKQILLAESEALEATHLLAWLAKEGQIKLLILFLLARYTEPISDCFQVLEHHIVFVRAQGCNIDLLLVELLRNSSLLCGQAFKAIVLALAFFWGALQSFVRNLFLAACAKHSQCW